MKKYLCLSLWALIAAGEVISTPENLLSDLKSNLNCVTISSRPNQKLLSTKSFDHNKKFFKMQKISAEKGKKYFQESIEFEIENNRITIDGEVFKIKDNILYNFVTNKPANKKEVKKYEETMAKFDEDMARLNEDMGGFNKSMSGFNKSMSGFNKTMDGMENAFYDLPKLQNLIKKTPIKIETKPNDKVIKTFASGESYSQFAKGQILEYKYFPKDSKKSTVTYSIPAFSDFKKHSKVKSSSLDLKNLQHKNKILDQKKIMTKSNALLNSMHRRKINRSVFKGK